VTPGLLRSPDRPSAVEWNKSRAVDSDQGVFTLTLSSNSASFVVRRHVYAGSGAGSNAVTMKTGAIVLLAQADGYLPIQSEPLQPGQTNYDFSLHRGSGPAGVVRGPDGQPAAGASLIYLAGNQQGGLDENGGLQAFRQGGQKTVTDAAGKFHFAPQLGAGKVIAASPRGFAWTTPEALKTNEVVILQPWARVHGRLVKDQTPVAGENVDLSHPVFYSPPLLNLHGTVTGEDGRFTIDFVPPGEVSISTRSYLGSDHSGWSNQAQRDFAAKAGEDLDLGDVVQVDPKK